MNLPTIEHLHERLQYDPDTGLFRWKTNRVKSRIGKSAGQYMPSGYQCIHLQGHLHRAHRIAYAMMTGAWPEFYIDHRNLDRSDNRWGNLRPATKSQNTQNTRLRADNKSGFKGVCWDRDRNRWRADIKLPHVRKHLGLFDDPVLAHEAYAAAAKIHYGEYGRVS